MKYKKTSGPTVGKRYLAKLCSTVLRLSVCVGLALGLYVFALSLFLIRPWWVKGNDSTMTIIFLIIVTLLLIVVYALAKRLNNLEKRHTNFRRFGKTMFEKHGKEINTLLKQRTARRIKVRKG